MSTTLNSKKQSKQVTKRPEETANNIRDVRLSGDARRAEDRRWYRSGGCATRGADRAWGQGTGKRKHTGGQDGISPGNLYARSALLSSQLAQARLAVDGRHCDAGPRHRRQHGRL